MKDLFCAPQLCGKLVCRCNGKKLQYFERDTRLERKIRTLKSQLR